MTEVHAIAGIRRERRKPTRAATDRIGTTQALPNAEHLLSELAPDPACRCTMQGGSQLPRLCVSAGSPFPLSASGLCLCSLWSASSGLQGFAYRAAAPGSGGPGRCERFARRRVRACGSRRRFADLACGTPRRIPLAPPLHTTGRAPIKEAPANQSGRRGAHVIIV